MKDRSNLITVRFRSVIILLLFITFLPVFSVSAQSNEPKVRDLPNPTTYLDKGLKHGAGFHMFINNFGFGLGGQYRRVVGPYSQVTATLDITSVRDVSEQRFQIFEQQVIPNKFNRVIGVPMKVGFKRRFFPREIADNFRLYGMVETGAILSFVVPYFQDINNNGFRDIRVNRQARQYIVEPVNDIFEGWRNAHIEWGYAGSIKIGVDFGDNFKKLSSAEFGFNFYYYPQGLQVMEPRRPVLDKNGDPIRYESGPKTGQIKTRPFYDRMHYFGTPQISLIFGSFW